MHDPLPAAVLIQPRLITRQVVTGIHIEVQGTHTLGMTVPVRNAKHQNVQVVLGVDIPTFQHMFFDRVVNAHSGSVREDVSPTAQTLST